MFGFATRRRNRLRNQPFPEAWLTVLRQNVPYYARLSAAEQEELRGAIQVFVAEKNFEGCGGLPMNAAIAIGDPAALPVLAGSALRTETTEAEKKAEKKAGYTLSPCFRAFLG
jgi:Mlc titration factor MtfA (ptsG expression regulator)